MLFSNSIGYLTCSELLRVLNNAVNTTRSDMVNANNAWSDISIYSGVQPSAADILTNWSNYNSSNTNFLAHYTDTTWYTPSEFPATPRLMINGGNVSATPINSGLASWAILWCTNVGTAGVAGATIPTTYFVVVPVGDSTTNAILRFNDANLVAGTPVVIIDGTITSSHS